jgi:hypothetical protein
VKRFSLRRFVQICAEHAISKTRLIGIAAIGSDVRAVNPSGNDTVRSVVDSRIKAKAFEIGWNREWLATTENPQLSRSLKLDQSQAPRLITAAPKARKEISRSERSMERCCALGGCDAVTMTAWMRKPWQWSLNQA